MTSREPECLAAMDQLFKRRSVSPKRLCAPGPTAAGIDLMLQAALRAPDHGGLHPWRVIEFADTERERLAGLFEQEKRRRDPLASDRDLDKAREHATRPPVLLAFVVSPQARAPVPLREQWLAAGAALCNLLNAAHQLGFGAIMLSGERCFDVELARALGMGADEFLAGFVSVGSVVEAPPLKQRVPSAQMLSRWVPGPDAHRPTGEAAESDLPGRPDAPAGIAAQPWQIGLRFLMHPGRNGSSPASCLRFIFIGMRVNIGYPVEPWRQMDYIGKRVASQARPYRDVSMSSSSGTAMKLLYLFASMAALVMLSACGKTEAPGAASPTSAPSSGASPDNSSTKGIKPSPSGDAPAAPSASASSAGSSGASAAAGPAAGATAIGGMAGGQAQGGATAGGAPHPTGGDGASGKPAVAPSK